VIGPTTLDAVKAKEYVVFHHCYRTAAAPDYDWSPLWDGAKLVVSHYALPLPKTKFLRIPLGIDAAFLSARASAVRDIAIMSSGFVSGPCAEAIEEVAEAALSLGLSVFHLGPKTVAGMKPRSEKTWLALDSISDESLAGLYGRCQWVSGLRHGEGFELPVIEGFMCGARPIVFDRPEMRHWYEGLARFIPEVSGEALIKILTEVLQERPEPITDGMKTLVAETFSWKFICERFWKGVLS
jgi:hypothetical protein